MEGLGRKEGEKLSADQLRRMEENRRKAQERLSNKRALSSLPPSSSVLGGGRPPPAKRPAITVASSSSQGVADQRHLGGAPPHWQGALLSSTYQGRSSSEKTTPCSGSAPYRQLPRPASVTSSCGTAPGSHSTSTGDRRRNVGPAARESGTVTSFQTAPSTSMTNKKYTEIQQKIKANFILVSRSRFKVLVPYNNNVIEIFKKMTSKSYDAKTATWSFGVEDYNSLVDALKKDCKYVDLSLIPRPVISLFQRLKQRKGPIPTPHSSSKVDWSRIEPKLSGTLMHFQREGVEFSVMRDGRVLIADDMGLGKTLQAIAVMSHYRSDWPLLVVCPSSVRLTWAEAFKRWLPSLSEKDINVVLSTKLSATSGLVNIISYDLTSKMTKELQEKKFMAVIADESHFLKNHKTARCKATLPIIKAAKRALLLSGTPALSRPIELYTQITALDKSFRSVSLYEFGQRYCNGVKGHFGWDFSGASNMHELQLYMEEAIMIRRFKGDVLDQLPTKRRQMVLLDPTLTKNKDKSDWKSMKEELTKAGKLKALDRKNALLPLFEKTGRVKIPAVRDYILDILEGGRKLIMFAHHKAVLDAVTDAVQIKGYGFIRIDGRTPAELRQTYCDQFQHDEKCLLAVLSITAANAGLTLTASSTVVFAELFWNPGILVQAEDRAYRIGQRNSVNVHYLVARDTVDDFIWPLIQGKLDVLSQAGLSKDDFSKADSTFMKDSSQLSLFECFSELISKEEFDDITDFDNSSSTPCVDDRDKAGCSASSLSTLQEEERWKFGLDDDPDFDVSRQKMRRVGEVSCSSRTEPIRLVKEGQLSETKASTVIAPKSTKSDTKSCLQKDDRTKFARVDSSNSASRLANYLLQSVASHDDKSSESQTGTLDSTEGDKGWFEGLDSNEDLEDFEQF